MIETRIGQQKVWNALAKAWQGHRQKPWKDVQILINKMLKMKKGKVLEIGCGNCRNLLAFAKAGFDCYGIDFSEEMLKQAVEFSKKNKMKLKLKYGLAERIPFPRDSFEQVLCVALLHHLRKENQAMAIKEIYRVLDDNGIALITVWNKFNPKFWKFLFKKERFVSWKWNNQIYRRYYYFFNYFELRNLLKKAGFKIIHSSSPFARNLAFVVKKIEILRRNY